MMRRFALLTLVLLVACGGEKKTGGGAGAGDKNHLVIAAMSSPTNIDSRVGNDNVSGRIFDLIYSGLVRVTPNMDYAPDVAEKWETPDDKTIVFHLNPKAKFHDGRPVKAADVKWTYDSLMAPDFISSKKSGYAAVDHVETPDDHTVIFKLKEPNAGIFDNLSLGILPTGADTNTYKTKPIGCGPYKVVDFRADDRVELEAFDDWHLGAPHIKKVTVRIIPDATTRVLELERGTVNFEVNSIPFDKVAQFASKSDFKVVKSSGSVYQYIAFNLHDPALAKKDVRHAIAHAIDRERIIPHHQPRARAGAGEERRAPRHRPRHRPRAHHPRYPARLRRADGDDAGQGPLGARGEPAVVYVRSGEGEAAPQAGRLPERILVRVPHDDGCRGEHACGGDAADAQAGRHRHEDPVEQDVDVFSGHRQGQLPDVLAEPQRHPGPGLLLRDSLLEEHPARGAEPRVLPEPEVGRAAVAGALDVRPRQAQTGVRRGAEDPRRRPAVHLALPAEQRGGDAEQHRRLRAVSGGILAVGAVDDDEVRARSGPE